ncbi:MAG: large subunit ribosomal protein L6 [Candidatus Peregrinibacteria bacterium Greene0416_62]|nr:MAG: large subunit ribosomal protein L6 [Candidatus Peregrinibacteria bacterium Greene0416_62]TSC98636.1 MAG: large subunit ribosomal protein L6 [Candidatus Peregrinibacteria bacterium Greene1014_49]
MSRIGRKPVALPAGVTATITGRTVKVKGAKGELSYAFLPEVTIVIEGSTVTVTRKDDTPASKARHGLTRQLIANMAQGVSQGYSKKLEIIGVGYKAQVKGKTLVLNLGHSHPIDFKIPEGITITPDEKNKNILTISGCDKQMVGQASAVIRGLRPPEPYKGKGIRYSDEIVRRKPGKSAVKAGATA